MSLDGSNYPIEGGEGASKHEQTDFQIILNNTSDNTYTLLWLPRLEFDSSKNIHDELVQECFGIANIFIDNFDNWYGSILRFQTFRGKQITMGTWFALVTEQYISARWMQQWIYITKQADSIGSISYRDAEWIERVTSIYFVWPDSKEDGRPIWVTFSKEDIYLSLEKILTIK